MTECSKDLEWITEGNIYETGRPFLIIRASCYELESIVSIRVVADEKGGKEDRVIRVVNGAGTGTQCHSCCHVFHSAYTHHQAVPDLTPVSTDLKGIPISFILGMVASNSKELH
ncbi:hypothetical protein DM860_008831 [Cuscuta australis]|uniref:Uncharacterized protein n=1 Tax=Cuscuta australis TaxID=267555 RepID=A0A328DBB6_9ASTE|nr:hypothetical protein DM860_008831 [Cuscuta australis]